MRLKEWFGWHFPEICKIVTDIYILVKVILLIKHREVLVNDFEDYKEKLLEIVGTEEVVEQIKKAADISMGVTVSE